MFEMISLRLPAAVIRGSVDVGEGTNDEADFARPDGPLKGAGLLVGPLCQVTIRFFAITRPVTATRPPTGTAAVIEPAGIH